MNSTEQNNNIKKYKTGVSLCSAARAFWVEITNQHVQPLETEAKQLQEAWLNDSL